MSRAKSAESIRHANLSWRGDSIAIIFAHMKNDQDGSRPRDPRHVYANPTMPEICPVLGFGIYFAVFGFSRDGKLFPGGNQYSRFLKILKQVLDGELMQGVLAEFGLQTADFGTHSARKGAATYVSSCSTSGPSAASICLRAGWTLPGVQDKYVRYEAAGDMVVGRYVAGLPFDSSKFATLPPFFDLQNGQEDERLELRQRLKTAMDAVFPGVPPSLRMIYQFGLASMLFHKSFLQQSLPSSHLLFATPLFSPRNDAQFEWLRLRVVCRNFHENDHISPTGIPPHVGIMVTLTDYKEKADGIRDGLAVEFEKSLKRHITESVMAMEAMEAAFAAVLARSNLMRAGPQVSESVSEGPVAPTTTTNSELYMWDGSFHRVPREFFLPSGTLRVVWQMWCAGQPPLRLLSKHDMSTRMRKVRLAELQRVMRVVETLLTNDEVRRAHSSTDAAGLLYEQVKYRLPFSSSSNTGRVRRLDQLSWRTLARELRTQTTS